MINDIFKLLTKEEREMLCDDCGMCCIYRVSDENTHEIFQTNIMCSYLDKENRKCKVYEERFEKQPICIEITPETIDLVVENVPMHCGYRCAVEGRKLPVWHPLRDDNSDKAKGLKEKLEKICVKEWTEELSKEEIRETVERAVSFEDAFEELLECRTYTGRIM